jgi:hypothetical protein
MANEFKIKNGAVVQKLKPFSDSTSSLIINNATDGSTIFNLDSTNKRISINKLTPIETLDVNGYVLATGHKTIGGTSGGFLKADGSVDSTSYLSLAGGTISGLLNVGTNNFKINKNDTLSFSYDNSGAKKGNTTVNFRSTGNFQDVVYLSDLGNYAALSITNTFQAVQWFVQGLTATGATFTTGNVIINTKLGVGTGSTTPIYPIHVGSIAGTNGISIYAIGDITAHSDKSVKSDLQIIPNAIDKVKKINGYTYIRTDMDDNLRKAGVIAQEVQEVLPEVITTNPDGTLSVAYANMVALLIEAIKEQQIEIDYLKSKLA